MAMCINYLQNAREYGAGKGWTDAAIAVHNGGTIRNSILKTNDGKVAISRTDSVDKMAAASLLTKLTSNSKR